MLVLGQDIEGNYCWCWCWGGPKARRKIGVGLSEGQYACRSSLRGASARHVCRSPAILSPLMFRSVADGSGTRDVYRDTVTPCRSAEADECGVTTAFVLSIVDDEVKVRGIIS